jgi:hypothetical protein
MRVVSIILTGIFVVTAAPIEDLLAFSDVDSELYIDDPYTNDLLLGYDESYADDLVFGSEADLTTDDSSPAYLVAGSPGKDIPDIPDIPEEDFWGPWTIPRGRGTDIDRPTDHGNGEYITPEEKFIQDMTGKPFGPPEKEPINPDPNSPPTFEIDPEQADAIVNGAMFLLNGVTWGIGAVKSTLDDLVPAPAGL